jgi:hypothetical protein
LNQAAVIFSAETGFMWHRHGWSRKNLVEKSAQRQQHSFFLLFKDFSDWFERSKNSLASFSVCYWRKAAANDKWLKMFQAGMCIRASTFSKTEPAIRVERSKSGH